MFFELSNECKNMGSLKDFENPMEFDIVAFDQHYDGDQYMIYVSTIEKEESDRRGIVTINQI